MKTWLVRGVEEEENQESSHKASLWLSYSKWLGTHTWRGCIPLSERSRKRMVSISKAPPSLFNPSSETGEGGRRGRD